MKPSALIGALGFLGVVLILLGAVWLFQLFQSDASKGPETNTGSGFFGSLFPFGRPETVRDTSEGVGEGVAVDGPIPKLRQISDVPSTGAVFVSGTGSSPLKIRYIKREDGHIYEVPADAYTAERLSNTTIVGVHDAYWLSTSTVLYRLSEGPEYFIGTITGTSSESTLAGVFIEQYTHTAVAESILGVRASTVSTVERVDARGRRTTLFTSPISSWVPHATKDRSFIASAPSGRAQGSLYEIRNGVLEKLVGNFFGLQALVSTEGRIAFSTGGPNALALFTLSGGQPVLLPLRTTVDKCTWARERLLCAVPTTLPPGLYPDDWLLGRVATNDTLWSVDPQSGTTTFILDPTEEAGVAMDMTELSVSADGLYAVFKNKNDQTLWALALTPQ